SGRGGATGESVAPGPHRSGDVLGLRARSAHLSGCGGLSGAPGGARAGRARGRRPAHRPGLHARTAARVPGRAGRQRARAEPRPRHAVCDEEIARMTESARPAAESLLARAREEGRARLRLYLGAAPGVGKTYRMLEDAHDLRRQGLDVVIGLVEPHGRAETAA